MKYCIHCGRPLGPDGICHSCMAAQPQPAQPPRPQQISAQPPRPQQSSAQPQRPWQPPVQQYIPQPGSNPYPYNPGWQPQPPKKKSNAWVIVVILCVAVLLVGALVAVVALSGGDSAGDRDYTAPNGRPSHSVDPPLPTEGTEPEATMPAETEPAWPAETEAPEAEPLQPTEPVSGEKRLRQMNLYESGKLTRTDVFFHNAQGQLTGVNMDFISMGETVQCAYAYDHQGRLIYADRDDFWVYFANEEYVYDGYGNLVCYNYYWGGGEYPYRQYLMEYDSQGHLAAMLLLGQSYDDNGREEQTAVAEVQPTLDELGRVTELCYYYIDSGTDVEYYAYDYLGRVDYVQNSGTAVIYDYDYKTLIPRIYVSSDFVELTILDPEGMEIWSIGISGAEYRVDEDGYIISVSGDGSYVEFLYE